MLGIVLLCGFWGIFISDKNVERGEQKICYAWTACTSVQKQIE
jgi:hypothetical protein